MSEPVVLASRYQDALDELERAVTERDRAASDTLKDVLWLIGCERDAAQTTGGRLDAIDNIERRIREHFHLGTWLKGVEDV